MQATDLLTLSDRFCAFTNRSESTISNRVTSHARLFSRLRDGKDCTVRTFNIALEWFDENWPEDLEWPGSVQRPSTQKRRIAG